MPVPDGLGVELGEAVVLSLAAGLELASDEPLQPAKVALARTPARRQATRLRRDMLR